MSKVYIRAELQNMAKREILEIIPQDTLNRIKQTDPKPEFRVFSIGHEGVAQGAEVTLAGRVVKAFRYVKEMVSRIGDRLTYGTPIFHGHVQNNSTEGREQVGELVGKAIKIIGDKVNALAAVYIYPQFRKAGFDVASFEGNVGYIPGESGKENDVIDIEKITGIALGRSGVDQPAFPGATCLGILQNFASGAVQNNRQVAGGERMKKEEIIAAIKEAGLKIDEIYTKEEIIASEPAQKYAQTHYEHARRVEESLGKEREKIVELNNQLTQANTKIKTLNEQVSGTKVNTLFESEATARKLDDKEKSFIQRNISRFKSDKEGDDLKNEFNKFVDQQLNDYAEVAKSLGVKVQTPAERAAASGKDGTDGKTGAPPTDGQGSGTDMTDAKNNDFIPKE
jgi:hypothetical protein